MRHNDHPVSDPTPSATPSPSSSLPPFSEPPVVKADPESNGSNRLIAISTVLAWLAVALAIASFVILAIPVSNRPIQDCGMPGMYLVRGTPNASLYDSSGAPKGGLDQAGLERAYENRCSKRVGSRAWPAAVTGSGFLLVGVLAWLLAYLGRRRLSDEMLLRWLTEQDQA